MKTIKNMLLLCLAISFSNCSTIKLTETSPFKVKGATYHTWVGGQPGVSGINLIIGIDNHEDIIFKSIYFRNRKVNTRAEQRNGKEYLIAAINTSKVLIRVERTVVVREGETLPRMRPPTVKRQTIPFSLKSDEAVIKYMVGKKIFYYKIENIKKTKTIFYP